MALRSTLLVLPHSVLGVIRTRVEAVVPIGDESGDTMEAILRRRFVEAVDTGDWEGQVRATLEECGTFLSPQEVAALEQAIALGMEPQPGEK